jgi:hypothetical protein
MHTAGTIRNLADTLLALGELDPLVERDADPTAPELESDQPPIE